MTDLSRAGLLSDLLRRTDSREELPDGLRLRFAPTSETLTTIAAVEAERNCPLSAIRNHRRIRRGTGLLGADWPFGSTGVPDDLTSVGV
jgi:hypothetical protein